MTKIVLTDEQLSAVDMVKENQISILTGGPGTGKTTTVREILLWARSQNMVVTQCAPTGKAAKRMMEATGAYAATIHRALGAMYENGVFSFQDNQDNPLPTDFLIVDEASMIPNNLMADLIKSVSKYRTKILIVGDQGQLPSVGAGAVLRDMLASKCIPHVELTQIHRNSGEIVRVCHQINKGKIYEPSSVLDLENGMNLRHVEAQTPERINKAIQKIIDKMIGREFDPIWDIQVLSPVNTKGPLSCKYLNELLQAQLNPPPADYKPKEGNEGRDFRVNDKVIQIKNIPTETIDKEPTFLVNGDMGQVLEADPESKSIVVKFFDPERIIKIGKKSKDLLMAYAITCHRAQGSEAPIVIIPFHKSLKFNLDRNWLYTAISRAKTMCFTVGQFSTIEYAIGINNGNKRETRLKEKIIDAYLEGVDL